MAPKEALRDANADWCTTLEEGIEIVPVFFEGNFSAEAPNNINNNLPKYIKKIWTRENYDEQNLPRINGQLLRPLILESKPGKQAWTT